MTVYNNLIINVLKMIFVDFFASYAHFPILI